MGWTHDRAHLARLHQDPDRDHAAILDARRTLRASRAEDYLRKVLATAPPLTVEQRHRLAVLLINPDDIDALIVPRIPLGTTPQDAAGPTTTRMSRTC